MNWFNNKKILFKILMLVGFMSFLTGGVGYLGVDALNTIKDSASKVSIYADESVVGQAMGSQVIRLNRSEFRLASDPTADSYATVTKLIEGQKKDFSDAHAKLLLTAGPDRKVLLGKIDVLYKQTYLPGLEATLKAAHDLIEGDATAQDRLHQAVMVSRENSNKLDEAVKNYIDFIQTRLDDYITLQQETSTRISFTLMVGSVLAVLIALCGGFALAQFGVAKPIRSVVEILHKLIGNDLNVAIKGADRKDEIGDVARAAQTFKEVLVKNYEMAETEKAEQVKKEQRQKKVQTLISTFDTTATKTVATVASASTQLSQTAEHMSTLAGEANKQSTEVASASEQASHNVQSVASAAEEMATTVQEISKQVALSNDIVRDAMNKAQIANASSEELVELSKSVGAIATLIENIAGQINLLALNATIESARSGEAGKGFAVVANEVKNLATQTAKATEQIREKLEAVQTTALSVAGSIGQVQEAIGKVNESSSTIAAAVEEQAAATQEIVGNMNTATQGVEQINNGIFAIKSGTSSTTNATREVLDAARMLSNQAEKMDQEVKTFLQEILAA